VKNEEFLSALRVEHFVDFVCEHQLDRVTDAGDVEQLDNIGVRARAGDGVGEFM